MTRLPVLCRPKIAALLAVVLACAALALLPGSARAQQQTTNRADGNTLMSMAILPCRLASFQWVKGGVCE